MALFLGTAIVISLSILSTIIYGLINEPERIKDFVIVVLLLSLLIIFMVDLFLWQIRGVEILIINDNIEILKKGKIFKSKRSILFSEFESFDYGNDDNLPLWIRLYGINGGKIIINYLGKSVRIGQDISINQAKTIVEEVDFILNRIMITDPIQQ